MAVYSRSNLIGVTYIHTSLTHSLTHSPTLSLTDSLTHSSIDPSMTYPDAPTKRFFFSQKNNSESVILGLCFAFCRLKYVNVKLSQQENNIQTTSKLQFWNKLLKTFFLTKFEKNHFKKLDFGCHWWSENRYFEPWNGYNKQILSNSTLKQWFLQSYPCSFVLCSESWVLSPGSSVLCPALSWVSGPWSCDLCLFSNNLPANLVCN